MITLKISQEFDYKQPLIVIFDGLIKFSGHHYDFMRNKANEVCLKIWDEDVAEIGIISLASGEVLFHEYKSARGWEYRC